MEKISEMEVYNDTASPSESSSTDLPSQVILPSQASIDAANVNVEAESEDSSINIQEPSNINLPGSAAINQLLSNIHTYHTKIVDDIKPFVSFARQLSKALEDNRDSFQRIYKAAAAFAEGFKTIAINFRKYVDILTALKDNQFTVWYGVDLSAFDKPINPELINTYMLDYFISNENEKLNKLINDCELSYNSSPVFNLLNQAISSMLHGEYHISAVGFTAILDSILSEVSENTAHKVERRLALIEGKLLDIKDDTSISDDVDDYSLYYTLFAVIRSFTVPSSFDETEPILLNRHWLMHGRSTHEYTLIDCIKVLSMIYGMILVGKLIKIE